MHKNVVATDQVKTNIANRPFGTNENHKASYLNQWWTTDGTCMILLHIIDIASIGYLYWPLLL